MELSPGTSASWARSPSQPKLSTVLIMSEWRAVSSEPLDSSTGVPGVVTSSAQIIGSPRRSSVNTAAIRYPIQVLVTSPWLLIEIRKIKLETTPPETGGSTSWPTPVTESNITWSKRTTSSSRCQSTGLTTVTPFVPKVDRSLPRSIS